MSARSTSPIHIPAAPTAAPLTAQQKKFNTQIRHIAAERAKLAAWEQAATECRARYVRDFVPLLDVYRTLSIEQVHFLDEASGRKGLTRADRETLGEVIAEMAGNLADSAQDAAEHEAMKAIYNRHAGSDFDAEKAEAEQMANDMARDMAKDLFGLDLDGVDLDSPDDVARMVEEQMQARQAEAERQRAAHQAKRRKPGARERKAQEDAQQATQSVRDIYRRLAAALHPDRETDPAERERKTALMTRANQAYEANNLLDLLHLQLEAEQIDPARIAALGDERLKHYNRVLAEQLKELRREVTTRMLAACEEFGLAPNYAKPTMLAKQLTAQVKALQHDSDGLRAQLRALQADPAALKPWIKRARAELREREHEQSLDALLNDLLYRT